MKKLLASLIIFSLLACQQQDQDYSMSEIDNDSWLKDPMEDYKKCVMTKFNVTEETFEKVFRESLIIIDDISINGGDFNKYPAFKTSVRWLEKCKEHT